MKNFKKKKLVFLGISGGVDSAVSAALLKKQGYNVVGVFIRTWHPDFIKCTEEAERLDAMRVCAQLDIPFLTFDFADIYKKEVADYMISEYRDSRTPNPDVMCNKNIKFGAFLEKALALGADYVATGHYSKINKINSKSYFLNGLAEQKARRTEDLKKISFYYLLEKSIDPSKDQSYFLWTLKQKQLSKIIFPIGHLNKKEVRILAKKFKLPVADKKDSQGICFLGAVDLKNFLKHYIKEKKGKVVFIDDKKEEIIGWHNGVTFFTLGERHGFVITKKSSNDKPYYVIKKDIKKNILYVSQNKNSKDFSSSASGNEKIGNPRHLESLNFYSIELKDVNWILEIPKENKKYTAQIRYHGKYLNCRIVLRNSKKAEVLFEKSILIDSGQSIVIYDKNICLGGGIVV